MRPAVSAASWESVVFELPGHDRLQRLVTAEPGRGSFDRRNVVLMTRAPIRSGRQVLRFTTATRPTRPGRPARAT